MEGMNNDSLQLQKNTFVQEVKQKEDLKKAEPLRVELKQNEELSQSAVKQDTVKEVKQKMKAGIPAVDINKEKDIEPAPEEMTKEELETKLLSMADKYKEKDEADSAKMEAVKTALSEYKKAAESKLMSNIRFKVHNLINACKAYCFMRFSLFRSSRGKQRLADVKKILSEAQAMENKYNEDSDQSFEEFEESYKETQEEKKAKNSLINLYDKAKDKTMDKYWQYKSVVFEENVAPKLTGMEDFGLAVRAMGKFIGYNTVRAVGTAIALPFVGVYTGISKLRQKFSKTYIHRPIDLSWNWKMKYFANDEGYKMYLKKLRREVEEEEGVKLDAQKYKRESKRDIAERAALEDLKTKLTANGDTYTLEEGQALVEDEVITQKEFEALKKDGFFNDDDEL